MSGKLLIITTSMLAIQLIYITAYALILCRLSLETKARKVLCYLNKYGFSNIKLTIYILDASASLEQVVALEQYFIDSLKPNLNVDLVASSSGYQHL